ncbi:MAG: hypothetical protein ACC652_16040, partial [Acidimicrobiales bacterium]
APTLYAQLCEKSEAFLTELRDSPYTSADT